MRKILYIGNKLAKHGAAPTTIDILPELLEKEGFEVKAVSPIKNKTLRLVHMLSCISFSFNYDLVLIDTYSTTNFWYAIWSARICRLINKPYIFLMHGGKLAQRLKTSRGSVLKLFKKAKANVVPSQFFMNELKVFGFTNLVCIPNFINLKEYSFYMRKQIQPRLLWVRAFHKIYNPFLAIKTFEKLLVLYPNATLCMVGPEKDGSLEKAQNYISDKNLPVKLTGKLSKSKWRELSKDYDIFLNTTGIDNTPVSILEAMALGLPIVSTKVGGIPYILENGKNAKLVDEHTSEAFLKAIQDIVVNPEKAVKMTNNARERAEVYDWSHIRHHWTNLLS